MIFLVDSLIVDNICKADDDIPQNFLTNNFKINISKLQINVYCTSTLDEQHMTIRRQCKVPHIDRPSLKKK